MSMTIKVEITNTDPNRIVHVYGTAAADDAPPAEVGPGARVGFYVHSGNSLLVSEAIEPVGTSLTPQSQPD